MKARKINKHYYPLFLPSTLNLIKLQISVLLVCGKILPSGHMKPAKLKKLPYICLSKSELDFLCHSWLFQFQVQKSSSNSETNKQTKNANRQNKKQKKNFIDSHTWKAQGGPGHRSGWVQRQSPITLTCLCCPLWGQHSQVTMFPPPATKWSPLTFDLYYLPAKRELLFPTCSNKRFRLLSHWPNLGYTSMLVKSIRPHGHSSHTCA